MAKRKEKKWEESGRAPGAAEGCTQRAMVQRPQLPAPAPGCYKHGLLPHRYPTIFFNYPCSWFTVTAGLRRSFPHSYSSLLLPSSLSVLLLELPSPDLWRAPFQGFTTGAAVTATSAKEGLMLLHLTGCGIFCPAWLDLTGAVLAAGAYQVFPSYFTS